ncbi:hypothetical protein I5M32_00705 [Pedobacter sp. SD-b]|uniref:Uncharacterized protein n=1 Tax=Pedobacter segetis TaxID=2793069 RepID=A0ABS1BF29_9SPHI|nr:hypothetical protein [Pedobacter segetis]MBK0381464.1 hypothetical protein [Pedobacter segetis]
MSTFLQIFINILCSVCASFIFLFLVLYLLRPKILISDYISKQANTFDDSCSTTYVFKIINKSFFSAFDVQLELFKLEQYRVTAKGINNRIKVIPMKTNEIKHIPSYITTNTCNRTSFAPHAVMFRTNEILENILKDEKQTLQLQITLRHGLTGLSRVYHKDYITINHIKEGQFKFGNSIDIDDK